MPEIYLGDGLYAKFTGYDVTLRAPREFGDHFVVLDGPMLAELVHLAEQKGIITRRKN